jgi:sigma-E factor negative regulatory protein RseA
MTLDSTPSPEQSRAALSAWMDGDASAGEAACRTWRSDASSRADWHAYALIGDLMRSDEHRADAAHDARMLARLREQLQREPVVLAPSPSPAPAATPFAQKRRARAWLMPAAVAAGFAVVAGTLVVTRVSSPDAADRGAVMAGGGTAPVPGVRTVSAGAAAPAAATADAPAMIRSAELDRYLAAHRQQAGGGLQMVPGGVVRQAAVAAPGR